MLTRREFVYLLAFAAMVYKLDAIAKVLVAILLALSVTLLITAVYLAIKHGTNPTMLRFKMNKDETTITKDDGTTTTKYNWDISLTDDDPDDQLIARNSE